MRILFLTPWYPSEKDAMSGLFVQKHAEAVRAQGCDVRVICSSGWCDMWRQWKALRREGWTPDVVQLNVIQKQGLLALWLKKRFHIPYIIIEHWSGYLPENGQFRLMHKWRRNLYRRIAASAEMILPVSRRLMDSMHSCRIYNPNWRTINNVVDDFFFKERKSQIENPKSKILLHVSCFDEQAKNVKGLLRAAKMLSEKRQDWKLVLIGTGVDYEEVRAFAKRLEIPKTLLEWTGELPPKEVAEWMHKADALVLSSRYETYGVVLAEAAAAGLPILSTPVGIAEELGALIVSQEIAQNKPGTFAEFMEKVLFSDYSDKSKKSDYSERFTADTIGRQLVSIYDSCLYRDI